MGTGQEVTDSPPLPCGHCGQNAPRARQPRELHRTAAMVLCMACDARTPVYVAAPAVELGELRAQVARSRGAIECVAAEKQQAQAAIDAAWRHWNRQVLIPPPPVPPARPASRAQRRPGKDDGPDPLELLARLLVPSTYRVPVAGRSSRSGLTTADLAAALGFMRDRLAKAVAIAVATRADEGAIARLTELARWRVRREVLLQRPVPLRMNKPDDRWRLRLALFDAAHELVWPERRRPYGELARKAKTRKRTYIVVHRCATYVLQDALSNARTELARRLYGWY